MVDVTIGYHGYYLLGSRHWRLPHNFLTLKPCCFEMQHKYIYLANNTYLNYLLFKVILQNSRFNREYLKGNTILPRHKPYRPDPWSRCPTGCFRLDRWRRLTAGRGPFLLRLHQAFHLGSTVVFVVQFKVTVESFSAWGILAPWYVYW